MKFKSLLLLLMVALLTVACNRQEKLLKKYEDACFKGDKAAAAKALTELKKKYPEAEWTKEHKGRIKDAADELEILTTPQLDRNDPDSYDMY
jgi:hypothetical protein